MIESPPAPAPAAERRPLPPHRRLLIAVTAAAALAVALAYILLAGGGSGGSQAAADVAPGINQPTADVLHLAVNPPGQQPVAPDFQLTDQQGRVVSLNQFRGKAVVFSVNDDQCVDLCTLLAEDVITADHDLGQAANRVVFLSVNANPFYPDVQYVRQWSDRNALGNVPNWHFATGSPAQLAAVWKAYGAYVQPDTAARTVIHSSQLYFIDPSGHQAAIGDFGDNSADTALFGHAMAQMAADTLPAAGRPVVAGPSAAAPSASNAALNAPAPGFRLPSLSGATVSSASFAGRPLVLNFWSSTCIPCRTELPNLEAAYRDVGSKVAFAGIDVSDPTSRGRPFAAQAGVTYPLLSDRTGATAGDYAVNGIPYTVVVGPGGHILVRHPGPFTTEQLEYVLQDLFPADFPGGH